MRKVLFPSIIVVVAIAFYAASSMNIFNLFKKVDQQQDVLGLEIFSQSEYSDFIGLVKRDLQSRGFVVGDTKDGFLAVKKQGKDESFGLINVAQQCKLAKKEEWPAIIKNHFDTLSKSEGDDQELLKSITNFDKIRGFLAVQLYPDDYLNAVGKMKEEVIMRSEIPTVNDTLVFDLVNSIRPVKISESEAWGKSNDELFAIALENTFKKIKPEIIEQQTEGGKVTFITSDSFLTSVLVLNLKKFSQCIGIHGSLVAIPTRGVIMCYPIENLGLTKIISGYILFASKLYTEGPGSLSSKVYWYKDGNFMNLPYSLTTEKIDFTPPKGFVDMLNTLK